MKEFTREFETKRRWRLWNGPSLVQTSQLEMCYWDDERILPSILAKTRWFCGVEVHKLNLVLAFYGINEQYMLLGPIQSFEYSPQGLPALAESVAKFQPYRFLMETTGIFHYNLTWFLKDLLPSAQVIVMNARLVSKLMQRTRKSDKIDATRLAQLARYDELLKPSYVPTPHQAILRELTRQRLKVVSETSKLKNRVKKLLAMYGCKWDFNFQNEIHWAIMGGFCQVTESFGSFLQSPIAKQWQEFIQENQSKLSHWAECNPPKEVRDVIYFLMQRLKLLECDQTAVEAQIQTHVLPDPEIQKQIRLIAGAPGLGALGLPALLTEIGTISRFPTWGHFLVYAGIAPSGGTSGIAHLGDEKEQVVERDHPHRQCNKHIKTILVRAAKVICSLAKNTKSRDEIVVYARKILQQKLEKFPSFFKVAAKLGRRIYYCLKKEVPYQERVSNSIPKQSAPSRRKRETRIKAVLRQKYTEIWMNSQTLFHELEVLQVPSAQIQQLMTLLYTGLVPDNGGGA